MKNIVYDRLFVFAIIFIFFSCNVVWADEFDEDDIFEEEVITTSGNVEGSLKINSKIAVVFDRDTKRIVWGKNELQKTAMASTTKIMTAIIIIENCNLNDMVVVSKKAALTGGSRLGLKENDKASVGDLLNGLLLRSGNDAAVALAEYLCGSVPDFANKMNEKAFELDLDNTHFVTPHGLDDSEHFTTAYELAIITDYALRNSTFADIVKQKQQNICINGNQITINNTNELLNVVNGIYGVKTRFYRKCWKMSCYCSKKG